MSAQNNGRSRRDFFYLAGTIGVGITCGQNRVKVVEPESPQIGILLATTGHGNRFVQVAGTFKWLTGKAGKKSFLDARLSAWSVRSRGLKRTLIRRPVY